VCLEKFGADALLSSHACDHALCKVPPRDKQQNNKITKSLFSARNEQNINLYK
jgi:hypothetical protein